MNGGAVNDAAIKAIIAVLDHSREYLAGTELNPPGVNRTLGHLEKELELVRTLASLASNEYRESVKITLQKLRAALVGSGIPKNCKDKTAQLAIRIAREIEPKFGPQDPGPFAK